MYGYYSPSHHRHSNHVWVLVKFRNLRNMCSETKQVRIKCHLRYDGHFKYDLKSHFQAAAYSLCSASYHRVGGGRHGDGGIRVHSVRIFRDWRWYDADSESRATELLVLDNDHAMDLLVNCSRRGSRDAIVVLYTDRQ